MHIGSLFSTASVAAQLVISSLLPRPDGACAHTRDAPKPHGRLYRAHVTGNLNGTTLVVPIPLTRARAVVPARYALLEAAWRELLPAWPADSYPLMVTAAHDHDVGVDALGIRMPDFSRAAFEFPFVDRLGDGYSSFRWAATMLMTDGHLAGAAAGAYGIAAHGAAFDPPCDAYTADGRLDARSADGARQLRIATAPAAPATFPYALALLRNLTNQPTFAGDDNCDNYVRLFNTSLTTAPGRAPVPVRGSVTARLEPLAAAAAERWDGVFGWRASTAFVEPVLPGRCESMQGYSDG